MWEKVRMQPTDLVDGRYTPTHVGKRSTQSIVGNIDKDYSHSRGKKRSVLVSSSKLIGLLPLVWEKAIIEGAFLL